MLSVNLRPTPLVIRPLFIRKNQLTKRERPKEANLTNRAEGASARSASTPYG
jgi:hypothetical protein